VSLSALVLSVGELDPAFDKAVKDYAVAEAADTKEIILTATTTDPKATMTVDGVDTTSGQPSAAIQLDATNPTSITIEITGEDGTTKDTYTLTVTVAAPLPANELSALTVDPDGPPPLNPTFDPATKNYILALAKGTPTVSITATCADEKATLKINDQPATSATPFPVTLDPGKPQTSIDIVVTPPARGNHSREDHATRADRLTDDGTYVISVTLGPSPSPLAAHAGEDGAKQDSKVVKTGRRKSPPLFRIQPRD
jgi:hypothetical protein